MIKYIMDAYAWIEYLDGTLKGETVREILDNPENEIFTCAVTLSEVVSKFKRRGFDSEIAIKAINALSKVIDVDIKLAVGAAEVHAQTRAKVKDFGLADAFVLACALQKGAKIVSGDPHFEKFKGVVFL